MTSANTVNWSSAASEGDSRAQENCKKTLALVDSDDSRLERGRRSWLGLQRQHRSDSRDRRSKATPVFSEHIIRCSTERAGLNKFILSSFGDRQRRPFYLPESVRSPASPAETSSIISRRKRRKWITPETVEATAREENARQDVGVSLNIAAKSIRRPAINSIGRTWTRPSDFPFRTHY